MVIGETMNIIVQSDAREVEEHVDRNSLDLTVTSPPYFDANQPRLKELTYATIYSDIDTGKNHSTVD